MKDLKPRRAEVMRLMSRIMPIANFMSTYDAFITQPKAYKAMRRRRDLFEYYINEYTYPEMKIKKKDRIEETWRLKARLDEINIRKFKHSEMRGFTTEYGQNRYRVACKRLALFNYYFNTYTK